MAPLNQIRAFVQVGRAGSLSAAARVLQVPRSTVSRRVEALEKGLGVDLLERHESGVRLTAAGRSYLEQCADALSKLDAAKVMARGIREEIRGVLRIAAPAGARVGFLGHVLGALLSRYPELRYEITHMPERASPMHEPFDVVLMPGPIASSKLFAYRMYSERLRLYASRQYLRTRGHPKTISDLEEHTCVHAKLYRDEPDGFWPMLTGGDFYVEHRLVVTNQTGAHEVVAAGSGIGLLSEFAAEGLDPVLHESVGKDLDWFAVTLERGGQVPKIRMFLDVLREEVPRRPDALYTEHIQGTLDIVTEALR